jgi:hypothetical protein
MDNQPWPCEAIHLVVFPADGKPANALLLA